MSNVFLYDVDDLEQVADENLRARRREADAAEAIVTQEVAAFEKWRRSGTLKPTIVGLRDRVRGVLSGELDRTLARIDGLSDRDRRSFEKMLDAMTNKLLHRTISELKEGADTPDGEALVETARRLFDVDTERTSGEVRRDAPARLETAAKQNKAS